MLDHGIGWQRVAAVLGTVALVLTGLIVVLRSDGFDAIDATVPRATRWFVHQPTGQLVLADGFSGRALARLDTAAEGDVLEVAQGASGVALIDRSAATARQVDAAELRLGPPQAFGLVAAAGTVVGVGQAGLVAVDTATADGVLLPPSGDAVPFDVGVAGRDTRIAPDGAVWTIAAGRLTRTTTVDEQVVTAGLTTARFTLVGARALVLDEARQRVRLSDGDWVDVPADVDMSEVVLQESGPRHDCGWIGADDQVWCIGTDGVESAATIAGLDIDGADRLAIAGDAAALVRRAPAQIVRFDWRAGDLLDDVVADVPAGSQLEVASSVDLIWIDQLDGRWVWSVNPWGLHAIAKNDASTPLLGESGEILEAGTGGSAAAGESASIALEREPDDDGIDDPPIAVDDPVTARTGAPVPVAVTANDYDPDGEAIVLVAVGEADHGTVELATGTTVVYQPESGFVGVDRFEYTIADGNGSTATAEVILELLPTDAPNQAPVGSSDRSETGPDAAVIVDVLLNDIDPERDSLRIDSFTQPAFGGEVTEALAASGLPGLRYVPSPGTSGTDSFTYRPVDAYGAVGEPVRVEVEIAQPGDENRPPIALPDAARGRRGIAMRIPVLANDRDPDGDRLRLRADGPFPPAVRVRIVGDEIEVTPLAGSGDLIPFTYTVSDGRGHEVVGSVLVAVIAEAEPNRPPIANADTASAVAGTAQLVDVLLNDSDPDGDPLVITATTRGEAGGTVAVQEAQVRYTAPSASASGTADGDAVIDRFTYTITDGNGHTAVGEVTVRVLPEPIAAPPFARDDAATTEVDVPVTLDVLRNDGDPSGERPTLVGAPGCAGGGTMRVNADSTVTYTPPAGVVGVFSCTYEVTNSQGLRAGATIVISVLEPEIVNAPPEVGDEDVSVVIGESIDVEVLANDRDPDGDDAELRLLSSTTPVLGRARRIGDTIRFEAGEVLGVVAIAYQVGDELGGVASGNLVIRIVEPDPEPPIALDDRRTIVGPGVATTMEVLVNDDDPDGDDTTFEITDAVLVNGDARLAFDASSVTFDPDPEFVGDLVATYTITDIDGLDAQADAVLTVLEAPNRPPVAADDAAEVVNGGSVSVPIAFNDADPDGDPLTYEIVDGADPALGTATLAGDGSLRFDAVPGANGEAVVRYRVDDGEDTDEATVRIAVLPCAVAPPEAPDLSLFTGYEQPIAIDLTQYARNGAVIEVGPPLGVPAGVYVPPPGENGNVTFDYVVENSCRIRDYGTVVIDVNQDPVARPLELPIGRVEPTTIPVTTLATDTEPLTIVGLEGAPDWVALVDEQRALQVAAGVDPGAWTFTAIVADPGGLRARVGVTVLVTNAAPTATDRDVFIADPDERVTVDLLAGVTDIDGDLPLSVTGLPERFDFDGGGRGELRPQGDRGEVEIRMRGNAAGVGSFTYSAVDALGAVSPPATVTVTINRPPEAPDQLFTVPSGATMTVALDAFDPDGHAVTVEVPDPDDDWTITIGDLDPPTDPETGALLAVVEAPDAAIGETAEVDYVVTDEYGLETTGTFTFEIAPDPTTTTTTTTTSTTSTSTTTSTTVPVTTTTTSTTSTTTTTSSTTTTTTAPPTTAP